jgi:hypothetical protein
VVGTGTGPLRYQWQKDGLDLLPSASVTGSTTATLTLLNAQADSQGSYRCIVSNTVGTTTSQDAALTVLPTQEASVFSIYPPVVRTGELVRVQGSHLNWTTRVHMVSGSGSQLVANVVRISPEELLITAPAAAAGQTLPLVITTRHSSITTVQQVSYSTAAQNNSFATARVLLPTDTSITGDNTSFTGETDEPRHALPANYAYPSEYDAVKSAWFQWRPTMSGTYLLTTAGSRFNTRLAVYAGSSLPALTLLGSNDDADPNLRPRTSQLSLYVTSGETYYFVLDGFDYSYFDLAAFRTQYVREYGPYVLAVTRRPGG